MIIEKNRIPSHLLKYFKLKERRTLIHKGYISHLCDVFDILPLKKTGTLWVNIDDSYAGGGNNHGIGKALSAKQASNHGADLENGLGYPTPSDVIAKSLIGIPERFVLEMMKRGWIRRNTIIWHKPNPMPESVTDRFTNDFEYLYMFVKSQRYYFERQFEEPVGEWGTRDRTNFRDGTDDPLLRQHGLTDSNPNSLGRNARAVWKIPTQGLNTVHLKGHYASYPEALCETPIKAGCPEFICSKCGKPREKVYKTEPMKIRRTDWGLEAGNRTAISGTMEEPNKVEEVGYSDCSCGAPFVSGIVCDPFAGTGTTLSVAKRLGRKAIGVELSERYCKLAVKRIENAQVPL